MCARITCMYACMLAMFYVYGKSHVAWSRINIQEELIIKFQISMSQNVGVQFAHSQALVEGGVVSKTRQARGNTS